MNLPWYFQEPFAPARPQDLVLWVNSSSCDGTTWRNLAPSYSNVNHGTLINGVASGDLIHPGGVFGVPRTFDGINQYFNCGNDPSLDITDAITVEARVKFGLGSRIVSKETSDFNTPFIFYISRNKLAFFTSNSAPDQFAQAITPLTYNDDTWHYFVGTISSTKVKIYVDGDEKDSANWTRGIKSSSELVLIGASMYGGSASNYFNGSIDEVRIYNRALSASDVVHNHTHSPIYYMQHGIDPMSLIQQTSQEAAHVVA